MEKVVLVGAGGKMGCRIADNLIDSVYEVSYLEVSEAGIARLATKGLKPSAEDEVVPLGDIVILAVPDIAIHKVAALIVPKMKAGAMAVCLDPAAPLAGALPERADVSYFAAHPAHPSIFNYEDTAEAHFDYFGGIKAKQAIVCALIQGPDSDYKKGEALAEKIYAPVFRSHRITIEQMGLLEPALSETFTACCLAIMKEGLDEVVKKGVPKDAARDFFLGHMNILAAVLFEEINGVFSDACNKAIEIGKPLIFKDDWKKVFDDDCVKEQIKAIT
ncbi:semialdehyde dehydrogenase [Mucilaginibacter limnophilus]|uniref:Semialdehyde dehydrogenase n=1 Tax=Mucilaginibacter limnophilus TaxID=1932778 RepID=A0A437MZ39_9SPHI|nr:phosphogluconate dehydrogenase C-terminal domain-containing protein [Mucilaginibacter limnophilus]RVU02917.1 semialdehyde dehydrogenase [Mucilaginibacter limnophilus]